MGWGPRVLQRESDAISDFLDKHCAVVLFLDLMDQGFKKRVILVDIKKKQKLASWSLSLPHVFALEAQPKMAARATLKAKKMVISSVGP